MGRDLGIRPHGLQALFGLRLEKGHVIVGMDTELDTTPAAPGHGLGGAHGEAGFIGRAALERTAKLPDERRCSASRWPARRPPRAARSVVGRRVVGNVSGSWTSPLLGQAVMLGWQRRRRARSVVEIDGREASVDADARSTTRRASVPALEPLAGLRVVADPAAHRRAPGRRPSAAGHRAPLRARRSLLAGRRRSSRSTTARHRRRRARLRRAHVRCASDIERAHRVAAADGRPAWVRAPSPACRPSSWLPDGRAWSSVTRRRTRASLRLGSAGAMSELHESLPADPLGRRPRSRPMTSSSSAAAGTGCRPPSTSPRGTGSRTSPSLEADYIAIGQHRPQHDHHPRQLRLARADALLPALARALPALEDETGAAIVHQTKGILWMAHTEMAHAHRARRGA